MNHTKHRVNHNVIRKSNAQIPTLEPISEELTEENDTENMLSNVRVEPTSEELTEENENENMLSKVIVVEMNDPSKESDIEFECNESDILRDMNFFNHSSHSKHVKEVLKLNKKLKKFESKMAVILAATSTRPLGDIIAFVLQSCEDYFTSSLVTGEVKAKICVKLLTKYIGKDPKLCLEVIEIALKSIKKSTFYRRNKIQMYKMGIFFALLEI